MQAVIAEHDAASKSSDSVHVVVTNSADDAPGLVRRVQALHRGADGKSHSSARRNTRPIRWPRTSRNATTASRRAPRPPHGTPSPTANISHDSSAALLASAQSRAFDSKLRATLDQRVDNQHRLSDTYTAWLAAPVLGTQERGIINQALRSVAPDIRMIILAALLLTRWIEHALGARAIDRRRMQTLYMVIRASPCRCSQSVLVLLVIFRTAQQPRHDPRRPRGCGPYRRSSKISSSDLPDGSY